MRLRVIWLLAAALVVLGGPANAAWYEAKSKHFIIYADDKAERLQTFAQRLERFDQAVRHIRHMDDPALTDSNRLRVYELGSEGAVGKLVGNQWARGMYRSTMAGSIAFVPRAAGNRFNVWDLNTEQIFFHEYAHHLQLQYSAVAMPPWVQEGFAEFFATAEIGKDGSVTIGKYPPYRVAAILDGGGLTIPKIVSGTYGKPSAISPDALYGWGWLLTHYLTFDKDRRGQLDKYVEGIQNGLRQADAAIAAFGNLGQLEHDVRRYVRAPRLQVIIINPGVFTSTPIVIRPLAAGEAAIMPVVIRSSRGVDAKTAPNVAADARKAAEQFPDDPFVQAALAEAEYDVGNNVAADSAADRALAADPKHVHALIYKGRAQFRLAKERGATADWAKIRQWFIKANKMDTENAEPLALFYYSFTFAGEKPTKNAIDALIYAVTLAPQDEENRMYAVRELIQQHKLAEARSMFATLAYQPHVEPEAQEAMTKIMQAITDGNGELALSLMDGPQKAKSGQAPSH
jgi:tetratricopeptide (TPR) repeat protein